MNSLSVATVCVMPHVLLLPVNTVIVAAAATAAAMAAERWRTVLSFQLPCCHLFMSHLFFLPLHSLSLLIIQSCIKGKANICLQYTFTDGGGGMLQQFDRHVFDRTGLSSGT